MRYNTYFLPSLPNSTDPILDYDVSIKKNIHIVCENVWYISIYTDFGHKCFDFQNVFLNYFTILIYDSALYTMSCIKTQHPFFSPCETK